MGIRTKIFRCLRPITIGSLILLFDRCFEPFRPSLDDDEPIILLVVEGMITDKAGAFGVSLTSTVPVYDSRSIVGDPKPVTGALVQIEDDIAYYKWEFSPPIIETIEVEYEKVYCWVSESSRSILIKSTSDSPANEIENIMLQSIGPLTTD